MATKKYVNLNNLATFLSNLRGVFASLTHTHNLSDIADYVVDSELSPTSTNPLQNKAVSEIVNNCETKSDASSKLEEAKAYTDTHINNKENPHEVTAEQIGAVTKEYVDEAVASSGSVKTINGLEPDENGNVEVVIEVPSFSVSGTTLIIGSISLPKPLIAYAVYSADDSSLSFYKTADTITEGSSYRGKMATKVYADIENSSMYEAPWFNDETYADIVSANFVDEGISPVSTSFWFAAPNCTNIIGLDKLNTSNVINMSRMFYECNSLTSIGDISNWDTSNVTDMNHMFNSCSSLTSVDDISNWDTSSVTNMSYMFGGCNSLTSVGDISNWDTSNVTDMSHMFIGCGILAINCSGWNVDNVANNSNFNLAAASVIAPAWKN